MKQIYTAFSFNGVVYTDLLNVSLDNSMASESMRGNRSLLREKIPGRDIPYFYAVEDAALEFDVSFATSTPKTKAEIRVMLRHLISPTGYKELHFGDIVYNTETEEYDYTRKSPIYKVIFDGDAKLDYIGKNVYDNEGNLTVKYLGYFTLKACADRPYGYENYVSTIDPANDLDGEETAYIVSNSGDLAVFPNIVLTNGATAYSVPVRIYNLTNDTSLTLSSLAADEVVTVNAVLKTISSTVAGVYTRWTERDDLEFDQGANNLVFQKYESSTWSLIESNYWDEVEFTFEAPSFIKE